jgi:glycosyltransferase involved in cell wall biosynthesis
MKISIIIPAYNEEDYITKTLLSLSDLEVKQDWEIETIVVNGGSTDETAFIARKFGCIVLDEPHKGIGFARQEGLRHATGEIIAFTDADTIVPKDWLVAHVQALHKPKVVFSYGTFRVFDGHWPYYQYINYFQPHMLWFFHHFFSFPVAAGQNMAFWRNKAVAVGGFDENLEVFEDIDLAVKMEKIGKLVFLDKLIVYSSGRRAKEGWAFFKRMFDSYVQFFILRRKNLKTFPDFR